MKREPSRGMIEAARNAARYGLHVPLPQHDRNCQAGRGCRRCFQIEAHREHGIHVTRTGDPVEPRDCYRCIEYGLV